FKADETGADMGEVARWRVAGRAAALAFKILSAERGVTGLEIGGQHAAAFPVTRVGRLLIVNKRHNAGHSGFAEVELRHAFFGAAIVDDGGDGSAGFIALDQLGVNE